MRGTPRIVGVAVAFCLAGVAHAQIENPFARLDFGVKPGCPFDCDSVVLHVEGDLTSAAWKVPVLRGWSRTGSVVDVVFDVEFNSGNALPVLVPFAFQIPLGTLPRGPYDVRYTFWIVNPIATMPSVPLIYYDKFQAAPPGDQNCDGIVDVRDVVRLVMQVFRGGPSPDPPYRADLNCDGTINVLDVIQLIYHVFRGGSVCDHCRAASLLPFVQVTLRPPDSLRLDPYVLGDVTVADDTLTLQLSRSGGCLKHAYAVFMSPPLFYDSVPRSAMLYPQHEDPGDPCDAWVTDTLRFNLREVADLYLLYYHRLDDISLVVHTYDQLGSKTVVYSPW